MAHEGPWSEDRFAALKAMRAEGMKVDAIAAFLGMTRGAVTGKLHRAGLCERTPHLSKPKGSSRVVPSPPPAAVPREPPPALREAPPLLDEAPRMERLVPLVATGHDTPLRLVDLQIGQCRWICNDPKSAGGALFCGHRAIPGKSWCRTHHAVVFQPHQRRVA
jgi:GcrA cell cycle regulator